jgi:hypothetical protein
MAHGFDISVLGHGILGRVLVLGWQRDLHSQQACILVPEVNFRKILIAGSLFAWLPIAYPETEFEGERHYLVGLLGIIGVVAYQIGAPL